MEKSHTTMKQFKESIKTPSKPYKKRYILSVELSKKEMQKLKKLSKKQDRSAAALVRVLVRNELLDKFAA